MSPKRCRAMNAAFKLRPTGQVENASLPSSCPAADGVGLCCTERSLLPQRRGSAAGDAHPTHGSAGVGTGAAWPSPPPQDTTPVRGAPFSGCGEASGWPCRSHPCGCGVRRACAGHSPPCAALGACSRSQPSSAAGARPFTHLQQLHAGPAPSGAPDCAIPTAPPCPGAAMPGRGGCCGVAQALLQPRGRAVGAGRGRLWQQRRLQHSQEQGDSCAGAFLWQPAVCTCWNSFAPLPAPRQPPAPPETQASAEAIYRAGFTALPRWKHEIFPSRSRGAKRQAQLTGSPPVPACGAAQHSPGVGARAPRLCSGRACPGVMGRSHCL